MLFDVALVATTNPGKLREITHILDGVPIAFKTLADFPDVPLASEAGASFEENARQKARHYGTTGLVTIAEDSGFEVAALGGEPGIHSARYLREEATYDERFAHIFARVTERGNGNRTARFVCALVMCQGDRILFETRATVEGTLANAPAGTNGFGYDPIFFYPPYGKTFGEVSETEKTAVSHRGQAMRALRAYLLRP